MALDFNTEPYFDDYSAEKDFYRILFRPSYAVQARELTQIQTILQNQVSRFGDHVFKNGSQVIPGSVNVNNKVHFIKLEKFTGTEDVTTYIKEFKNKVIVGETSGVRMVVIDTSADSSVVDNLDEPTLYCQVEGTADNNETYRLQPGENIWAEVEDNLISTNFRLTEDQLVRRQLIIKATGSEGEEPSTYLEAPTVDFPNPASSNVLGYAYSVDVKAGIYYVDGIFVRNDDLKIYAGRFTNTPSYRVGFKVTEEYITPEDDESILDNATGSYNFAAPGAHRYQIKLSLVKLPLVSTDTFKFIELVRIVNGRVQTKIDRASYSELEKTFARRTHDESGNYEVNKFKLSIREHLNDGANQGMYPELIGTAVPGTVYGDPDKFVLVMDPGKAYINGYEIESTSSQFIEFDKARENNGLENGHIRRIGLQNIGLNYGNYVKVNNLFRVPDIKNFTKVYLVKKLQPKPATFKVNLSGGAVSSVDVIDGGFGYSGSGSLVIKPVASFAGTPAVATANVTNGKVTSVTVGTAGTGYSTAPNAYFISNLTGLGVAPSASDIVGTARVKALQLASGSYSGAATVYNLGLVDISMNSGYSFDRDVKSVIGTAGSGNFSCDVQPTLVNLLGTGTSSTSSTTVTGSGTAFEGFVKAGDIVYLNDKRVGTVSTFNNTSITLAANAEFAVTDGRISIFTATIYEPKFESLLFPVGQSYVKTLKGRNANNTADTEPVSSTLVRRLFGSKTSSNNIVEFKVTDTDETIEFDTDLSNYTLINNTSGLPVDISETTVTFNSSGPRQTVYISGVADTESYSLIASVAQEQAAARAKQKVLNENYEFDGAFSKNIAATSAITLAHCDIFKLKSVLMNPGTFDAFDEQAAIDITDRYTLDNGQRDTYYGAGRILLKPGFQMPNGAVRVVYDYFEGGVETGNYFSVDSYTHASGVPYADIPSHYVTDQTTGKRVQTSLADVLDFRPYLAGLNAASFKPELPKFGSGVVSPIAYYIGRVDKVSLDSVGKLNVITGVPSANPKEPSDPKEGMVIASIFVPPYTKSVKEIVVKQQDNRRYTMRDIGKLERRIANLEYYVTLSLLEKDTADLQIKDDTTGLDRFKNGFIVDQFTGHGIGDVKNQDYRISVDKENRILRPMHDAQALELVENLVSGTDRSTKSYKKTGDLITLPYTESAYIFNNHASRAMDIHAMSSGAFKGQITLIPEGDNWKSTERRPDLIAVDDNNYDAIKFIAENAIIDTKGNTVVGTKWNEWQTNWTSIVPRTPVRSESRSGNVVTGYETTYTDYVGYDSRDGIRTDMYSVVNAQDYGDRVVDVSYVPYMRARPVTVIAQNLKPSTRFFPFFDNVAVTDYFKPTDVFTVTRDGSSLMSFNALDLDNNILADSDRRTWNNKVEQAFSVGDVLTNASHTAVNIESIDQLTDPAASFNLYVTSTSGIRAGHHVFLYNLDNHAALQEITLGDLKENQGIPQSSGLTDNTASAKELNFKKFKVLSVSGTKLVLGSIDGSLVPAFSAYSTASYDTGYRGLVLRLKASGVVVHGGVVQATDTTGKIVTQDIHVANIKNGFSIGEVLTGSVNIANTASYNGVSIDSINGTTSGVATMKAAGDKVITDKDGTAVGVFYIPETDALSFRTGERTFKFTDNAANSNASFDSIGSSVYYSQGISLSKERTIVSSRSIEFVQAATYEDTKSLPPVRRTTTSVRKIYQYAVDPLAQTFTVSADGGCFVTSVDLYFAAKGNRPVSIEIRNTDNGVPSSKIVPFSKVTKPVAELAVSDNSSVKTTFTFKSPIYLQDTETYALVVLTDEPGTQVYVSEMGQVDILTSNTIAGQPLTGSLYASQNAKEWEIHSLLDIKFTLNKAEFDITSSPEVEFRTIAPGMAKLPYNPFEITPGTNKVRVYAPNHGLLAGEIVTIDNVPAGYYGANSLTVGIPHTLFNTKHTVLSAGLEKDSFVIAITTTVGGQNVLGGTINDFIKGEYGGANIQCSRGIPMDVLYLRTSDLNFQETSIKYSVITQNEAGTFNDTNPYAIVANANHNFDERMVIRSVDNQETDINNNKRSSLQVKATLYSSNPNISPVLDLQQVSAYAIANMIDDQTAADINVAEIDTRKIIGAGDTVLSNYAVVGTGTISVSNSSTAVVGVSTAFTTAVSIGNILTKTDGTVIGTVQTITDNTHITLASNYTGTTLSNVAYDIGSTPSLVFENVNGVGVIRTNIDTADNLLASVGIGKSLSISGVAGGIDGDYVVTDVQVSDDTSIYYGNTELDKVKVFLNTAFGTTTTINMAQDVDFNISVQDKFVSDIAPYGVHNAANYVTRTLQLTDAADSFKVIFDGNIVNNTDVKVYYRTWTGDVDLLKVPYKDTGASFSNSDPDGKFVERTVDINGIEPFYNISIKIVMKSSNPVFVPMIKNLRLLALS